MKSRPDKTHKIISKSRHLKGLLQISRQQQQILDTIKQLLDKKLAVHCISAHYSRQCLKLYTDSSVWASRLRFQSKSLAKQLAAHDLPAHKIDVRVIPKAEERTVARKKRSAHKISADAAETIIQTADSVNDENLEAALKKLAKSVTKSGAS